MSVAVHRVDCECERCVGYQKPPRTGYHDTAGVYHPGPNSVAFDEHANTCMPCELERRNAPRSGYIPDASRGCEKCGSTHPASHKGKLSCDGCYESFDVCELKFEERPFSPIGAWCRACKPKLFEPLAVARLVDRMPWWSRLLGKLRVPGFTKEIDELRAENQRLIDINEKMKLLLMSFNEENAELYRRLESYTGAKRKKPIAMPTPGPGMKVSR